MNTRDKMAEMEEEARDKRMNIIAQNGNEGLNYYTPAHYDNSEGSLYKIALLRGWNPYLFDIVKRLERSEKKGEFVTDLKKSKKVIDLWLNENNKHFKLK
jgi:hypothetical protein